MKSMCMKLSMADHITSVLTTLSRSPVTRHSVLYHVMLFLLIHGLPHTSGVRIVNCKKTRIEIFEDSPAPVTCGDITSTADVYWRRGEEVNTGLCYADGNCKTASYNDYRLSRSPQSTESQLTLVPDYRRHAGVTVTCQDRESGSTASCTLIIRRHSVLSECHVTTNPVDGTVSGSCRVQQAFSSDNIYTCTWTRNTGQQTFGGFDNSRERCSFINAPLPQEKGVYTFTIVVFPPPTTGFSQTVTTENIFRPVTIFTATPSVTGSASCPDSIKWIVAGIITGVIFLVLLITSTYIQRRKLICQGPVYEAPTPLSEDVHTYTELQAGHSINTDSQTFHRQSEDEDGYMVCQNRGDEAQVHPYDSVG